MAHAHHIITWVTYLSELDEDFSAMHECLWRFVRDATSGQIVYENAYDKNGNMRTGYEYLAGQDDRHTRLAYYVGPNGSLAHFRNSPASMLRLTYLDGGELGRIAYLDRDANPQTGPDHAYGRKFEYDRAGHEIAMTSVDRFGENMNDTAGNATARTEYDASGNRLRSWALDAVGQPTDLKEGFSGHRSEHDQVWQCRYRTPYSGKMALRR